MHEKRTFGWLRIEGSLPFYAAIISTYIHLDHRNTPVFESRGPIRFFTEFHNPRLEHFERLERTAVCLTTFVLLFAVNCRRARQNTSFLSYNAIAPKVYSILEDTRVNSCIEKFELEIQGKPEPKVLSHLTPWTQQNKFL